MLHNLIFILVLIYLIAFIITCRLFAGTTELHFLAVISARIQNFATTMSIHAHFITHLNISLLF